MPELTRAAWLLMELIWEQIRKTFGLTQANPNRSSTMDLVNEDSRAALADFDWGWIGSQ